MRGDEEFSADIMAVVNDTEELNNDHPGVQFWRYDFVGTYD